MAAIFALILLPALAAVGFILKTSEGTSFGVLLAKLCFVAMAAGLFYGLLRMARGWENETLSD
jgi:hypothetical protein